MKNYFLFLMAFVLMLSFFSCSQDDPVEEDIRKEVMVTATFRGLSSSVTPRALDNSWETGDAIGLFMKGVNTNLSEDALAYNVKYTTTGSTAFKNLSESKVYFPFDKSKVDFISYYPYKENLNGLTYPVDVSDQSSLSAIDLMYSDNAKGANSTNENVNVEFEHQLSNVIVSVDIGDTGKEPTDFSVKITNVNTKASFSLANGLISDAKAIGDVSFNVDATNTKAQAILLPDIDLTDNTLVVTIDESSYLYDLSKSNPDKSFEKSKKYEFELTLRAGQGPDLDGLTATIKDWIATVPENGFADEIPITGGDEGGKTEPDEGETPLDPDAGGEDGDPQTGPVEGDGTQENPYTIAQSINLTEGSGVWIKGYIVGGYKTSNLADFTSETSSVFEFTAALADVKSETLIDRILPVDIEKAPRDLYKKINLKDNPLNMDKEILLKGDVTFFGKEPKKVKITNIKSVLLNGIEL